MMPIVGADFWLSMGDQTEHAITIRMSMSQSPPMTPLRFTLSKDLVVKAAILSASRYYVRFLLFSLIVSLLVSAFFLFGRSRWELQRELLAAALVALGTFAMALLIIALMRYVIYPFHARRNFRQQKALSDEMSLSWADEAFCYTTGKSRTEMPFANLHGYRASSEIIILYLSDALYYAIPAEAFGDAETFGAFMRKLEKAGVKSR
jgi:hypothetical protein